MKKLLVFSCAMLLLFGFVGIANATLWDRGGGLIYDDVLDITWLQDANYAQTSGYDYNGSMRWENAVFWADTLSYYDSVRNVTYDDWRLPDAHNQDGSGPDTGYNVTGSEMGHMFYNYLDGTKEWGYSPKLDFIDGNGNSVSFQNLQPYDYWSGTVYSVFDCYAWDFYFHNGLQDIGIHRNWSSAWAVRDGDVAPVPEPATMLILGSGLIGLVGFRRKFMKR